MRRLQVNPAQAQKQALVPGEAGTVQKQAKKETLQQGDTQENQQSKAQKRRQRIKLS
jgi:hypothetical protein